MDADWKPSDVKTVLEAHDLLPEGPLLEEAIGLASLYADRIQQRLGELPASVSRQKAILAILEEGFMQEGLIPSSMGENLQCLLNEEVPNSCSGRFRMPGKRISRWSSREWVVLIGLMSLRGAQN